MDERKGEMEFLRLMKTGTPANEFVVIAMWWLCKGLESNLGIAKWITCIIVTITMDQGRSREVRIILSAGALDNY